MQALYYSLNSFLIANYFVSKTIVFYFSFQFVWVIILPAILYWTHVLKVTLSWNHENSHYFTCTENRTNDFESCAPKPVFWQAHERRSINQSSHLVWKYETRGNFSSWKVFTAVPLLSGWFPRTATSFFFGKYSVYYIYNSLTFSFFFKFKLNSVKTFSPKNIQHFWSF